MSKKNGNREVRKPKQVKEKPAEISAISQQSLKDLRRTGKK
jgi:hypothetical protein